MTAAYVRSVNVGRPKPVPWGDLKRSAIDKRPVRGPVRAQRLGLVGDEVADLRHHGGVDQAVYAYAREDLDWWAEQLGRELRDGQFGENLTVVGLDVTGAVIGERWRIGSAELEVADPRIPCSVFQGYLGEPKWVKRFTQQGRPGAYLRVTEEGELTAGDRIEVVHRPDHDVRLGEVFRALTGDRDLVPKLLLAPELPEQARDYARKILASSPWREQASG
ncbi:MAG: MOSC domain-containing protein [Sporichthyaceae bacterium]|nr:MOSC domain-containing protein [Sporichthyaceae bacterium]